MQEIPSLEAYSSSVDQEINGTRRFIASASHLSAPWAGSVDSLTELHSRTALCDGDAVCL
jgi:hypothetical protein